MARIRTVKPDFMSSPSVGRLSRGARLFFLQLLTQVDDEGRAYWIPKQLNGAMYPFDDIEDDEIIEWASECVASDMLCIYEVENIAYLTVTNFKKHQRINRPTDSKLPSFDEGSLIDHDSLTDYSLIECVGNGKEQGTGKGTGKGTRERTNSIVRKPKEKPQRKTIPPEREWVLDYAELIQLPELEAVGFFDHFTGNGWRTGSGTGKPMKDWQSSMNRWKARQGDFGGSGKPKSMKSQYEDIMENTG